MAIDGRTMLLGLLGWPVKHTFSPAMHNAAAAAAGLNAVYLPLPVRPERLSEAVRGLAALHFRGVNVTVPHKEMVMGWLTAVDPAAQAIGAVNTIVIEPATEDQVAHLQGHNTDWSGFLADLQARWSPAPERRCFILGAGGSARAVAYALATVGCQSYLFARRPEQAEAVVRTLQAALPDTYLEARPWSDLATSYRRQPADLVVNTTPLGMVPDTQRTPWPEGVPFVEHTFVYDLVYNPTETMLLQEAQAQGCAIANGLGMLVGQGAEAFRLWTGHQPDVAVMAEALRADHFLR